MWSRGCLTSAALSCYVYTGTLCAVHCGKVLGDGGVDAYGAIKVLFGDTETHGDAVALCDLTRVGTEHVKTQYTLLKGAREREGYRETERETEKERERERERERLIS